MFFISFVASFQRFELVISYLSYNEHKTIVGILRSLCRKMDLLLDNDLYLYMFRHFNRCEACFREEEYFNRCCKRNWRNSFSTLFSNLHLRSQHNYRFSSRVMHKFIVSDDARKQLCGEVSICQMLDRFLLAEHAVLRSLFNDAILHSHADAGSPEIKVYRMTPWVRIRAPTKVPNDGATISDLYKLFLSATGSTGTTSRSAISAVAHMADERRGQWYISTISSVAPSKVRKVLAVVAAVRGAGDEALCRVSAIAFMRTRFETNVLETFL